MTLGERLRKTRIEAGITQKALCGDQITRNMLSLIEHGAATPSLETMMYLASRLGKPVSFFLEEELATSDNQAAMRSARRAYDKGDAEKALEALESYQEPDAIYDREKSMLYVICRLKQAQNLLETGRERYARQLLKELQTAGVYCSDHLEERRRSLLARLEPVELPNLDEGLLLRAYQVLRRGDAERAGRLLDAAENQDSPHLHYLRGLVHYSLRDYEKALDHLQKAHPAYPEKTLPLLEESAKELGEYRLAYEYACKRRDGK